MEMQQQWHWSPQHAMNAYLNTIHLASELRRSSRSSHHHEDHEPKCMELLSALAAGNGAKLVVQITSPEGITPLTLALSIAANQTNGRLIIIIPHHHHHHHHHHQDLIQDSIEIVRGNPYEIIKEYKKIDFLVVDSAYDDDDDDRLWKNIDVNPMGCLVVVIMTSFRNALFRGKRNYYEKINSIMLPIGGEGIELLRIRPRPPVSRRYTRFHVTYEN